MTPKTISVPARADLIIVDRHGTLGFGSFLGTAMEGELFVLAANSYAHCLRALAIPQGQSTVRATLSRFADLIEATYCCSTPTNRQVVSTLRVLHDRMVAAEAASQQLLVPEG